MSPKPHWMNKSEISTSELPQDLFSDALGEFPIWKSIWADNFSTKVSEWAISLILLAVSRNKADKLPPGST